MADMQDFAGVVALAIKAAMAPVFERVAQMEAKVTALSSVDGALTELRERVVVAETKAATIVPVDVSPLRQQLSDLESRSVSFAKAEDLHSALTELRDRVVVMETKAEAYVPVDLSPVRERVTELESKAAGLARGGDVQALQFDVETLKSRVAAIEQRPAPEPIDVNGLRDRIVAVETKAAEPVRLPEFIASGQFSDMVDRTERITAELSKDLSTLRERVAVAEVRQGVAEPGGAAGKDGRDGIDGVGFDDFSVDFDGERTLTLKAARGERQKSWPVVLPYQYQRGVYVEGKTYQQGDLVTWAGSQWHANEETTARPGEGSKAWTLVVKRGRDGKDGKDAVTLPVVTVGGPVADFVSLAEAQRQLRWPDSELALRSEELQSLIDQATAIVLGLCNTTEHWRAITPTWDEETVPVTVKTAVLKQVAYLNQFRGDDQKGSAEDDGFAPGVRSLLRFTSDPVVA